MGLPIEVKDGELPVPIGIPIQEKEHLQKGESQDKNPLEITIAERYLRTIFFIFISYECL